MYDNSRNIYILTQILKGFDISYSSFILILSLFDKTIPPHIRLSLCLLFEHICSIRHNLHYGFCNLGGFPVRKGEAIPVCVNLKESQFNTKPISVQKIMLVRRGYQQAAICRAHYRITCDW